MNPLPHCLEASIAIFSQRRYFSNFFDLSRRGTDREEKKGVISLTPNSVAFCIRKSIFSPLRRLCAKVISKGDSSLEEKRALTLTTKEVGSSLTIIPPYSFPEPSKTTISSPALRR